MMRFLGVLVLSGLAWATLAHADVYGSDPTVNLGATDTCQGCLTIYFDFPGSATGQTVTSYSFYAGATSSAIPPDGITPNQITPMLFEYLGPDDFTVVGIGTTETPSTLGLNTYSFGLVSGIDVIAGANTYFGWFDGNASTGATNLGTVSNNYSPGGSGSGPGVYFSFNPNVYSSGLMPPQITAGENLVCCTYAYTEMPDNQTTRTYSANVSTSAPEPGFYGVYGAFAVGLISLLALVRRRKTA